MIRTLLLLSMPVLAGCMPTAMDAARDIAGNVHVQSPVGYAPPPASRPYAYLCDDGTRVAARYHGTRSVDLAWPGRTTSLRGFTAVGRDDRSGRPQGDGYRRDDVSWHRHGAEAQLHTGAFTRHCLLVPGPPVRASVVPDTMAAGPRAGKL